MGCLSDRDFSKGCSSHIPGGQVDFSLESRLIAPLCNARGERSFDLSILATPLSFVARVFVAAAFPIHRRMIDFNELSIVETKINLYLCNCCTIDVYSTSVLISFEHRSHGKIYRR